MYNNKEFIAYLEYKNNEYKNSLYEFDIMEAVSNIKRLLEYIYLRFLSNNEYERISDDLIKELIIYVNNNYVYIKEFLCRIKKEYLIKYLNNDYMYTVNNITEREKFNVYYKVIINDINNDPNLFDISKFYNYDNFYNYIRLLYNHRPVKGKERFATISINIEEIDTFYFYLVRNCLTIYEEKFNRNINLFIEDIYNYFNRSIVGMNIFYPLILLFHTFNNFEDTKDYNEKYLYKYFYDTLEKYLEEDKYIDLPVLNKKEFVKMIFSYIINRLDINKIEEFLKNVYLDINDVEVGLKENLEYINKDKKKFLVNYILTNL